MLQCKNCKHFRKDHPSGLCPKDPENDLYLCDKFDWYCFKENICIGPDDPEDLEDMDLEDQLEYLLNDDVSEIGYDPYLGCYTDDC